MEEGNNNLHIRENASANDSRNMSQTVLRMASGKVEAGVMINEPPSRAGSQEARNSAMLSNDGMRMSANNQSLHSNPSLQV